SSLIASNGLASSEIPGYLASENDNTRAAWDRATVKAVQAAMAPWMKPDQEMARQQREGHAGSGPGDCAAIGRAFAGVGQLRSTAEWAESEPQEKVGHVN